MFCDYRFYHMSALFRSKISLLFTNLFTTLVPEIVEGSNPASKSKGN